ncbi:MAG TPA: hypothetical protein VFG69_05025 [Nannocystaceae bacterium]|nr:hypothetical protein [Nannocystaceae bacterium]
MAATKWIHVTSRVSLATPDLCAEDTGGWLWEHMREAFPEPLAVVLMPDHPHLVLAHDDPAACERRLTRLLGQFGRRFGVDGQIGLGASASPILADKLDRNLRYALLNPCRAGLVRCPLAWPFSTHRDVVGAIVRPWVTAPRLARALETPLSGFVVRHHAYVSADPSARVDGTPFSVAATPRALPNVALRTIAEAVAAALRVPIEAIRSRGAARSLFVALACEQGWDHPTKLAEVCRVQARAIPALARGADPRALAAARLCLGDARLRALPATRRQPAKRSA